MQAYVPQETDRAVVHLSDNSYETQDSENTSISNTSTAIATNAYTIVKSDRPNYFIGTADDQEAGNSSAEDFLDQEIQPATNCKIVMGSTHQYQQPVPPNSLFDPYPIMDLNDPDAPSDDGGVVTTVMVDDLLSPLAHRVDSAEITFQKKRLKPKFIPAKCCNTTSVSGACSRTGAQDEECSASADGVRYLLGDVLGEGCYSKVKEVMDMRSLRRMAVKIMTRKRLRKIANGEENCQREIALLRKLSTARHENVIHMYDLIVDRERGKFYVILEYCAIVLQELIDSAPQKRLPIFQAHSYFVQLINGLDHLHSLGIIHKDIKPGNLLINNSNVIKICDFGVAELIDRFQQNDHCKISQGTPAFQPPEIADGAEWFSGSKVDIWSAGVTLYNITSGTYPFDGDNVFRLFGRISACVYTLPAVIQDSDELADLIRKILTKSPAARASIREIRRHPWVARRHHPLGGPEGELLWGERLPPLKSTTTGFTLPGRSTTVQPYLEVYYSMDQGEGGYGGDDDYEPDTLERLAEDGVAMRPCFMYQADDNSAESRLKSMAKRESSGGGAGPGGGAAGGRTSHYNPSLVGSGAGGGGTKSAADFKTAHKPSASDNQNPEGPPSSRRHSSAQIQKQGSAGSSSGTSKRNLFQLSQLSRSKSILLGCIGLGPGSGPSPAPGGSSGLEGGARGAAGRGSGPRKTSLAIPGGRKTSSNSSSCFTQVS